VSKPCAQCPWRLSNQGTPHPHGFYTQANLRRLWNQLRGGGAQSCHLTDPRHPDHVAAGAKPGAQPQECPGSVIIVLRELHKLADDKGVIGGDEASIKKYLAENKRGLKKNGILYWTVQRIQMATVKFFNPDGPLPAVDVRDPTIGRPEVLR
jgi:hypothetical protein